MADPLSVTASVVGITVPVLHGIRRLIDDIQKIVEAPETLHQLLADLVSLSLILNSIEAIEQSAWQNLGDHVFAQFKHTLELCERACKRFRGDLNNWTGSSASDVAPDEPAAAQKGKPLSWKGRFVVGFLRERQIKAMAVHIQGCKITCNCLIGVAVLYVTLQSRPTQVDARLTIQAEIQTVRRGLSETRGLLAVEARMSLECAERRVLDPTQIGLSAGLDSGQNACSAVAAFDPEPEAEYSGEEHYALSLNEELLKSLQEALQGEAFLPSRGQIKLDDGSLDGLFDPADHEDLRDDKYARAHKFRDIVDDERWDGDTVYR